MCTYMHTKTLTNALYHTGFSCNPALDTTGMFSMHPYVCICIHVCVFPNYTVTTLTVL